MKGRESQCSVYYCIFFLIPLLSLLFSSLLYSPFPFPVIYLVFPFFFFSSSFFLCFCLLFFFCSYSSLFPYFSLLSLLILLPLTYTFFLT